MAVSVLAIIHIVIVSVTNVVVAIVHVRVVIVDRVLARAIAVVHEHARVHAAARVRDPEYTETFTNG